jgi:hypothetical protein
MEWIIVGIVTPIVLGLVAYIFRRLDKSLDGLSASNEKLSGTVSGLRATMMAQEDILYEAKKEIKEHDVKLDSHEVRITVIEKSHE